MITPLRRWLPQLLLTGLALGWIPAPSSAAEERAPGPMENEFPVATVSALLRPAAAQRLAAPVSGRFHLAAKPGTVAVNDVIGRFEDAELRAAVEIARLRLRAARQQETDFIAEAPARRQEAMARISDLEGRLAMAEAVAKNPGLLHELPAAAQTPLLHADPAGLRAQLEAERARLTRLDTPGYAESSSARLQVLEAERTVREVETQLRESAVVAPIAGVFQPAPSLTGVTEGAVLGAGQEIGTLRDLTRLVAAVPALSPYLVRVDLTRTLLRLQGPGGKSFNAQFRGAVTEVTPVMGETRVFLYEFSAADSRKLADMVQTNVTARILLTPAQPVALADKLQAALDHPDAFRDGWVAGVAKVWPGWTLLCEGETALGLVRSKP